MRLFISYAHKDTPLVRERVVEILRAAGHDPWFDHQLLPGRPWQEQLLEEIQRCDAFVYALTPESIASEYCQWEFKKAVELGKPVVPVLLIQAQMPDALSNIQYVDFTGGTSAIEAIKLTRGLNEIAVRVPSQQVAHISENPVDTPPRAMQKLPTNTGRLVMMVVGGLLVVAVPIFFLLTNNANAPATQPIDDTPAVVADASDTPSDTAVASATMSPRPMPTIVDVSSPIPANTDIPSPTAVVPSFGTVQSDGNYEVLRVGIQETSDDFPLDPANANDPTSAQLIRELYAPLMTVDEEFMEVKFGIAEHYELPKSKGRSATYTFYLRQNVPWVSYDSRSGTVELVLDDSGEPRVVTADDFVYGWTRMMTPGNASYYGSPLAAEITGGLEFIKGETSKLPRIEALDEFTLQVTTPQTGAYQLTVFSQWWSVAHPEWAIDAYGETWIAPGKHVSYGPYALKDATAGESVTLVQNPYWQGTPASSVASIEEIQLIFLDADAAIAAYTAGELDVVDHAINWNNLADGLRSDFSGGHSTCTFFYGLNLHEPPFSSASMRRAFSYAIDREALVQILGKGDSAAPFFLSPPMIGVPPYERFTDLGIQYDPEQAVAEFENGLVELGYGSANDLPPITLVISTSESHSIVAEIIIGMWTETFGIEVELVKVDWAEFLDSRASYPVWRGGWCSDYPDAHNLMTAAIQDRHQQDANWQNQEFDALLDAATEATDLRERQEYYAQAENILVVEDAALIPLYWAGNPLLSKPYVAIPATRSNYHRFENWHIQQ